MKYLIYYFEAEYNQQNSSIDNCITTAIKKKLVKNETDFHASASQYFQKKGDLLTAAWAAERAGLPEKADLLREQVRFRIEREMYFWPIGYRGN